MIISSYERVYLVRVCNASIYSDSESESAPLLYRVVDHNDDYDYDDDDDDDCGTPCVPHSNHLCDASLTPPSAAAAAVTHNVYV